MAALCHAVSELMQKKKFFFSSSCLSLGGRENKDGWGPCQANAGLGED